VETDLSAEEDEDTPSEDTTTLLPS